MINDSSLWIRETNLFSTVWLIALHLLPALIIVLICVVLELRLGLKLHTASVKIALEALGDLLGLPPPLRILLGLAVAPSVLLLVLPFTFKLWNRHDCHTSRYAVNDLNKVKVILKITSIFLMALSPIYRTA